MKLTRSTTIAVAMSMLAAFASLGCAGARPVGAQRWGYTGDDGPSHWGDVAPEFATCKTGTTQSPIDIAATVERARLIPIVFHYDALPLRIEHLGYTFQVLGAKDMTMALGPTDADRYTLAQLHFHAPSEHTVAGRSFAFELHLVHKNLAGASPSSRCSSTRERSSPRSAPIFDHAPTERAEAHDIPGVKVDVASLVPVDSGYTEYMGSLTVPPCTEGVRWLVLSSPLEASAAQIQKLRAILHQATNRPVQPVGGRRVLQFSP